MLVYPDRIRGRRRACEGELLAVISPESADTALEALCGVEGGEEAQIIGEVRE